MADARSTEGLAVAEGLAVSERRGTEDLERAFVRAAASGHQEARERFFELYFEPVYSLLRMALPNVLEIEAAVVAVLATALEESRAWPPDADLDEWVSEVALEEIALRAPPLAADALQARPAGTRGASADHMRAILLGLPDRSLAAAVRALELPRRQAVVLGLVAGQHVSTVAAVMGRSEDDVLQLQREGLDDLILIVQKYEADTQRMGVMARNSAYHLRPKGGPMSDGIVVIRGTKAHVAPGPRDGFMHMALKLLERFLEKLLHRHHSDVLDDDVGDVSRPKSPPATAGGRQLPKPEPTPSMRDYRQPKTTPGMPTYRTPGTTPSTARITNPRVDTGARGVAGARRAGLTGRPGGGR